MAIQIKHAFTSPKGDGTDATMVQPSYWNALHATSMATNSLIGRLTAGAGAFEEIPISPYMAGLLASADVVALAAKLGLFTVGDIKFSISNSPGAGWLTYTGHGTLGSTASAATYKNDLYINLFKTIWNNVADSFCPVVGGRGASADVDWSSNKQIYLPQFGGRAVLPAGSIPGLTTARSIAQTIGEEIHTLIYNEMPSHRHSSGLYNPGHWHTYVEAYDNPVGVRWFDNHFEKAIRTSNTGGAVWGDGNGLRVYSSDGGLDTTYLAGADWGHNNMQPSVTMWVHIKL